MSHRLLPSLLAILIVFAGAAQAAEDAPAKAVLMLYGGSQRSALQDIFNRVLRRDLVRPDGERVEIFEEYLDEARFPGRAQEERFAEFLRDRYSGRRLDVLMTVESNGLRFLARHRDSMFPGVPVISLISKPAVEPLEVPPDFLTVEASLDPGPTMQLALRLRPQAREVVAVVGTSEVDRAFEQLIRETPLPTGVRLRVLSTLSLAGIERELARLGPDSVVVTSAFRRDGAGQTYSSMYAIYDRLHAASTVPLFHIIDHVVGRGALGSNSVPLEEIAAQGAAIARQLLEGTAANAVIYPPPAKPRPILDAREMRRWGIDESQLPAGSVVRFREPTFWDRYRNEAIGVALFVMLETLLVVTLLAQRSHRRRAEERLRHSEQTMRLAGAAANIVMWNWNVARDVVWTSEDAPGGGRPAARTLASLLGHVHPEDEEGVRRAIRRALSGDGVYESEYRILAGDGATQWRAGRGRMERGKDESRWLCGVTMDITERKAAEIDIADKRNELAHLSRVNLLGELSSSMAHELNQPLTAILANAEAARLHLQDGHLDKVELAAILDDIIEADTRAGDVITSMRKMLRKETHAAEPLNLNDLVGEVLRLMRSDLLSRGAVVEYEPSQAAPTINADRVQLQQVLINLIVNACDAMIDAPRGQRVLQVRTEAADGKARVVVSDHGPGVPPEMLKGIFKPFFSTKAHGLGLGLSVCSSILALHGGALRARNNAEGGASFIVELEETVPALA